MHPIVINYQQRQQYILIIIAAIVMSFGLGYWFGYHSSSSDDMATVLSQIENQPVEDDGAYAPDWSGETMLAMDTNVAADKNEPARPETRPTIVAKPAITPVPAKPVEKPVVIPAVTKPAPVVVKPPAVIKPVPAPALIATPSAVTPTPTTALTAVTTGESITNSTLSAEAANTVFTVQAGVFESRDNAMKLVDELNAKSFDAYIEEIVANSGETKFNVRFGRNTDREQVQRKLTRFKQLYTTSAYIIILDK
jgi:cell division septation protein DedD